MNYSALGGIFLEGVLSFLSPCVMPLIPLYMSYLAADSKIIDEEGNISYQKSKVFITTLFFVLGICSVFALLTLSLNSLKSVLDNYSEVIGIAGGTLLIIFGLHQCGLIHIDVLEKQLKPQVDLKPQKMSFLKAYALGFVFSLGWSPCIGPLLANAIFMAASDPKGYLYIIAYAAGMVIPFLLTGLFTEKVLEMIRAHHNFYKWTLRIAGIIMICFGCYMISNAQKNITALKNIQNETELESQTQPEDIEKYLYEYDFHYLEGPQMKLSDYQGKYIFLNFTTTWCPYCLLEQPEYEKLAEEHQDDVACLFVMTPLNETAGLDDINSFYADNPTKLQVLIDEEGVLFYYCRVDSYPTTFVISPTGSFLTYFNGALDQQGFESLLEYAKQLNEE